MEPIKYTVSEVRSRIKIPLAAACGSDQSRDRKGAVAFDRHAGQARSLRRVVNPLLTAWIILAVLAVSLPAQNPPPPGRGRGPGARFLAGEPGMPGRVVKNAPFTGDLTTETTQTLADGNRIHQTATAHMVRDSEGRTRREQSLSGLGALGSPSGNAQAIFIDDPVAGVNYALNPKNHTAAKSAVMGRGRGGRGGRSGPPPKADFSNAKTESLGRETMEGLPVDGTRITLIVPAGQLGNDLPFQVVTERWYSSDLQMNIMTKRSDPRNGETVTRLTNVSRAEPAHSLFEVPADYKVSARGPWR